MNTAAQEAKTQHRKILVIEDDTLTRNTLCNILAKLKYETHGACNGLEGLRLFRQIRPDVVVTDLLMPDKEGLSTITEIRTLDPHVLIIAMSGGGSARDLGFLELAETFGADRTLSKPFTPRQILDIMSEADPKGE